MSTPAEPADGVEAGRRRFLTLLSLALGAVGAALLGVPFVSFMVAPLFERTPRKWRSVGSVDGFTVGATVEVVLRDASPLAWSGTTAETAAWLRRVGEQDFVAFSMNCTHLGCPVRWVPSADLFLCPCHGGVYYADGEVAAGPPPRGLVRYPVRVRAGRVEVLTSPIPIA